MKIIGFANVTEEDSVTILSLRAIQISFAGTQGQLDIYAGPEGQQMFEDSTDIQLALWASQISCADSLSQLDIFAGPEGQQMFEDSKINKQLKS